ncbi:MAG: ATP-dependent helicase [Sporichthyaceae bacterium]
MAKQRRGPTYRLVRTGVPAFAPPGLDAAQRAVVEHAGGPLLVLAGPGTGKTTTLVEAVAARVAAGVDPERILVLTFSRKAAAELRDRIGRRLARTTTGPAAATFHSFCYSLLAAQGLRQRLLSGAEQDVAVRELLRGTVGDPLTALEWPAEIAAAIGTRGLAEEVRDVLSRVAERGVDLHALAHHDPERAEQWRALAAFTDVYLDVIEARGVADHAGLVLRAAALAEEPEVRAALREQYRCVFVDEYQDVDPAQVRLLQAIAGDGRDLVVFGDPDQAIYGFRGADVREILSFGSAFPDVEGNPASAAVLRTVRRYGPVLQAASRAVVRRLPLSGLDSAAARLHRDPDSAASSPGQVAVRLYPNAGAELEAVAEVLRRAHLEDGTPWSDMAVLVRSGTRTIPAVRRAFGAAGIPFSVASDELPLRAEPAVGVLRTALRFALDPASATAEDARDLLLSPLAGVDPAALRVLGRLLRSRARAEDPDRVAPSAVLLRDALLTPAAWDGVRAGSIEAGGAAAARALGELLAATAQAVASGADAHDVLWLLWSGTNWPTRLELAAAGRGPAAERAGRDLDAVCALFDVASRAVDPHGRSIRTLLAQLDVQQIPGDRPLPDPGGANAVSVMTAHRSKGLEWPLVVVTGVQEGVWPDLRRRGSFLSADRLRPDGLAPAQTANERLAEERRLFYVAITRAAQRLLVTAVASPDEAGDRPSRFLNELSLDELGVEAVTVHTRPVRSLSASGLVANLRAVLVDPDASDALRAAAAERLAVLAAETDTEGLPLVPAADPARWWGMVAPSVAPNPIRDAAVPVALSGSTVAGLSGCPLRWFLGREVRADDAASAALGFGNVLHALAEEVAAGGPADLDHLMGRLDTVWSELAFDADWQSRDQREAAREALRRFLAWHLGRPDRTLLGVEVPFDVELDADGERVRVKGRLDRVEQDAQGRTRVVDLKTNKSAPTGAKLAAHPQLGVYQAVVEAGGLSGTSQESGGAELVMLRQSKKGEELPRVYAQTPLKEAEDPEWVHRLLGEAARRIRAEAFAPVAGEECDTCAYRRCCSARAEGSQVVT